MKLTSRGELALKAMLELAKVEGSTSPGLSAAEIARRCNAPMKFLEQVLAQLKAGGLGGRPRDAGPLAPPPRPGVTQPRPCDWCEDEATCTLKTVWTDVRDVVAGVM